MCSPVPRCVAEYGGAQPRPGCNPASRRRPGSKFRAKKRLREFSVKRHTEISARLVQEEQSLADHRACGLKMIRLAGRVHFARRALPNLFESHWSNQWLTQNRV